MLPKVVVFRELGLGNRPNFFGRASKKYSSTIIFLESGLGDNEQKEKE